MKILDKLGLVLCWVLVLLLIAWRIYVHSFENLRETPW
jgi:hypothetical protein